MYIEENGTIKIKIMINYSSKKAGKERKKYGLHLK